MAGLRRIIRKIVSIQTAKNTTLSYSASAFILFRDFNALLGHYQIRPSDS
jgi:hypothetical protein